MQISAEAGPCIDCFRTGHPIALDDIRDAPAAWSQFQDSAVSLGFLAIQAVPLRLRDSTIGTLNLLRTTVGPLAENDLVAAQALADVATIGIIQERTIREADTVRQQLQHALDTRIVIEQAKGVVAHQRSIAPDDAFDIIRRYARTNQLPLSHVATQLIQRQLVL